MFITLQHFRSYAGTTQGGLLMFYGTINVSQPFFSGETNTIICHLPRYPAQESDHTLSCVGYHTMGGSSTRKLRNLLQYSNCWTKFQSLAKFQNFHVFIPAKTRKELTMKGGFNWGGEVKKKIKKSECLATELTNRSYEIGHFTFLAAGNKNL